MRATSIFHETSLSCRLWTHQLHRMSGIYYVTIAEIKWEMLSNQRSYGLQHMCKWLCSVLQIWTSNSSNETNVTWHSISWYVSCLLNKTTFNTKQVCDFVQFWSTYTKWKPQWQFIRQFSVVERPNQAFTFSFSAKEGTGVDLQEKDGLTENEKACQRLNEIWQEANSHLRCRPQVSSRPLF